MAFKKIYRKTRKTGRKVYQKVYGSRSIPKAIGATAKVAADVAKLAVAVAGIKAKLNVEKKFVDSDPGSFNCGQTNGNGDGIFMLDVTPFIPQGTNSNQRNGNSLKLTGISMPLQFQGNNYTMSGRKIKVQMFRVVSANNSVTLQDAIRDYYDPNPINGIVDYMSPKAYRSHKHDGIKLIRSKIYTLEAPTLDRAGDLVGEAEAATFSARFNVKLQDVLRYEGAGSTLPDGVRYYLYVFVDKGNASFSVPTTTLDVPIAGHSTGVFTRFGQRSWFVDN